MKCISFGTRPTSPFAPQGGFLIGEESTDIDCDVLKDFLLSKEEEVLSIPEYNDTAFGTYLGKDSTTARSQYYNVLTWDNSEIHKLRKQIYNLYYEYHKACFGRVKPENLGLTIGCWMNIMRKGDRIKKHQHSYSSDSYLSGHFCVSTENTKTVYVNPYEHQSEDMLLDKAENTDKSDMVIHQSHGSQKMYVALNVPGKLTLFPNYVPHFTTTYRGDDVRITLAFDLRPKFDSYIPLLK